MALHGYEAPNFMDLLLSDSRVPSVGNLLQESQDIVKTLKEGIESSKVVCRPEEDRADF